MNRTSSKGSVQKPQVENSKALKPAKKLKSKKASKEEETTFTLKNEVENRKDQDEGEFNARSV